jgi:putative addiction module component (TIGR02574 family)
MSKLKDEVLKLPVEEQFEIYNTLQEKFEKPQDFELTPEQMEFINERLDILESGHYTAYSIDDLRARLDALKK